jgi:hypothetical protein
MAEGGGEHGLADPGWPDKDHVRVFLDESQRAQILDEPAIEGWLCGVIECLERRASRQLGKAQSALCAAYLDRSDLVGKQVM